MRAARPRGHLLADLLAGVLFLAVQLVASPRFSDQFTTVKWHLLEAVAAIWFVIELCRYGSAG